MAHRFVEHPGEVELELEAASERGVFEAALGAFGELVGTGEDGEVVSREVELAADDDALLLVEWLSELVFLAEVEQFVPERLGAFELADHRLRASVQGHRNRPRHVVKAVTLNGLELEHEGESWHGRVVLDV
ncbi:MAG: archease [Verrucomicrobiota bacterium]